MDRPRIGITTSLNPDGLGAREQRLDLDYVRAVERAGGLPLIVPMVSGDAADAFADLLDGLVVTGGPAVTRGLVGEQPDDLDETDPLRSASDERLLQTFLDGGRPVLGICYGMQLASALLGGTIWADAERDRPDTAVHSRTRDAPDHAVRPVPGTRYARLVGGAGAPIPSRHAQAVERPGRGLVVSATATDGVIEALETADGAFLGVQFHPETLGAPYDALFSDLVARARAFRERADSPARGGTPDRFLHV